MRSSMHRQSLIGLIIGLLMALAPLASAPAQSGPTVVFAAASLKTALDAAVAAWIAGTGQPVTVSYAAASTLAKQIELGAPADLFLSADLDWMNYLQTRSLIRPETRRNLFGNALVLIAPAGVSVAFRIGSGADLGAALGDGRLAVGEVTSVPAGKYGKAALTTLGLWEGVKDKLAAAESVRTALALVARGEAPLGIVYATDARAEPKVVVVDKFPATSHPPIVYPVAILASSAQPGAAGFLDYLSSPPAAALFAAQGFTILP